VIDEFLGILIIVIFYDIIKFTNDILMFVLIFFLFRFFDIVKIYPANWIDKNINNSLGVILDDLVAGVYCVFILVIINAFL
jgi:phosphatidylglycerophosphatase A